MMQTRSGFRTLITHGLLALGLCLVWVSTAWGNAQVKKATSWYLKGNGYFKAKQYSRAASAFNRAYRLLPRHPHFNCHRAQFLNYMGRSYEKLRKPHTAMKSYYTAGYRSGCKTAATRNYAAGRYRSLYNRWMCSISFATTPPKGRIYQITSTGDKKLGGAPYKKVFPPGKYQFKIRLYDHRTIYYKVDLRAGRHLKKVFKMVKGDDPVTRVEKVDIAPPVPMSAANNPNAPAARKVAKIDPNKVVLGGDPTPAGKSGGLDTGKGNTGGGDITNITQRRKIVKPGPPVYKQAWFWAVIGGVAVAAVVIPIAIPKEQKALINQGKMF